CLSFFLQVTLQLIETGLPECPIPFEPTNDALQRDRVDRGHTLPSDALINNETRLAKHAQVLGNGWAARSEICRQGAGVSRSRAPPVENLTAGRGRRAGQ